MESVMNESRWRGFLMDWARSGGDNRNKVLMWCTVEHLQPAQIILSVPTDEWLRRFVPECKLGSLHQPAAAAAATAATPCQLLSPGSLPVLAERPLSINKGRHKDGGRSVGQERAQTDGAEAEDAAAWKQMRADPARRGCRGCSSGCHVMQWSKTADGHQPLLFCFKVCRPCHFFGFCHGNFSSCGHSRRQNRIRINWIKIVLNWMIIELSIGPLVSDVLYV